MKSSRYAVYITLITVMCLSQSARSDERFSVRILETDPSVAATLHAREPFYVRIAYQSDVPLRFQAAGYDRGMKRQEGVALNPAPVYGAGTGHAIGWIAGDDKTRIDEIRVHVFDESWRLIDTLSAAADIRWNGAAPRTRREPAAWATELSDIQQHMTAARLASTGEDNALWGILVMLMAWSVPGYFVLQIYMWLKYREHWRRAALLPLWVMVPLFAYSLFALFAGSNLWPLMLIFFSPLAFIYLICVLAAKSYRERAA